MQPNAPFGKIILICSQWLTRHTNHQVYEVPLCTSDQQLVLTPHAPLSSFVADYDWLKPCLSY